MLPESLRIHLSNHEIWVLLQEFSSPYLIGVEDPFKGRLAKDANSIRQQTYQSLEQRDFIRFTSGGKYAMNEHVHLFLLPIANPDNVVAFSNTSVSGFQQNYYYFYSDYFIEKSKTDTGQYQLTLWHDIQSLIDEIMGYFPRVVSGEEKAIKISFKLVRALAANEGGAFSDKLSHLYTNDKLNDLINLTNVISVFVFPGPQKQNTKFLSSAVLICKNAIWLRRKHSLNQDFTTFQQTPYNMIKEKIERMLTFNNSSKKGKEMQRRITNIKFGEKGAKNYDLNASAALRDIISAIRIQEEYPETDENGELLTYGLFMNGNLLDSDQTLEELNVANGEQLDFTLAPLVVAKEIDPTDKDIPPDIPFEFYSIDDEGSGE